MLVGTPLGNREDLGPRARRAIVEADLLLCEDTRSPSRLLGEEVELPRRVSCFVGNERGRIPLMLDYLREGKTVAYVSEAGMPVWSDPGRVLVEAALDEGFAVDVIPGPTAAVMALCMSGFPAAEVLFLGFPPRDGADRSAFLDRMSIARETVVLYEAGNRVPALLADLTRVLPDASTRRAIVARELTKLHQDVARGSIASLAQQTTEALRGEVTLVVEGTTRTLPDAAHQAAREVLETMLDPTLKPRERAKRIAKATGLDTQTLYDRLRPPPKR